jgi:hypothetical protein
MRLVLACCIILALGACGAGPGRTAVDGQGRGFFISPNGQPFRFDGGQPHVRWFAAVDVDADGRLSKAEFSGDARRFFAAVDADANRLVTSSEVSAWRAREARELESLLALIPAPGGPERRRPRQPTWTPEGGFSQARVREGRRRPSLITLLNEREPVLASDADFNRRVSPEEYEAATGDRFRLLDLNGDGALTGEELAQFIDR